MSPSVALVVLDASIKNNIATSILHIHMVNKPLTRTIYQAVNVRSTKAELLAIRCGINQATHVDNISRIIVITDSIHAAQKIFDPLNHPFQIMSAAILSDLCNFFNRCNNNSIKFWECPSCLKWRLHNNGDKATKAFNLMPILLCKNSWNFSKKSKSNNIIKASNHKGNHFLELVDNNDNIIEPTYIKGGLWLKVFDHSNLLCARATRAITPCTYQQI